MQSRIPEIHFAPQKCMHTLIADGSILQMKCILVNTVFIIIQCVFVHFPDTRHIQWQRPSALAAL